MRMGRMGMWGMRRIIGVGVRVRVGMRGIGGVRLVDGDWGALG